MELKINTILQGNCIDVLKTIPDESVNCCITSPPYYALRDYGTGKWVGGDEKCDHKVAEVSTRFTRSLTDKSLIQKNNLGSDVRKFKAVCPKCGAVRVDDQIGLEGSPEEYIDKLVEVFREVKRVLKDDGTLWLNIGDSYWGSGSRGWNFTDKWTDASKIQSGSKGMENNTNIPKLVGNTETGIKNKDLVGIPWMLAFALRQDGWYLRQDIIWHKPNPMPESVTDRCTKSHEYIFLLSKKPNYYFDHMAIQEESDPKYEARYNSAFNTGKKELAGGGRINANSNTAGMKNYTGKRNKRDVWDVTVKPVREAHFATYPEELVKPCIMAGTKIGDVVLDPFFGSGTTGIVARSLNRNYIGIELNPQYIQIAKSRLEVTQLSLYGLI